MKKFISIILTLSLVLSMSAAAIAEYDETRWVEVSFYEEVAAPAYYVTIPEAVQLSYTGMDFNYINIKVSEISNLPNAKAVGILLADASHVYGMHPRTLALHGHFEGKTDYDYYLRYAIHGSYHSAYDLDYGQDALLGYYNEEGSDQYYFEILTDYDKIMPNVAYSGYIVFGIKLINIP